MCICVGACDAWASTQIPFLESASYVTADKPNASSITERVKSTTEN